MAKIEKDTNVFVDATSGAALDEAKEFYCPMCESTAQKPLPDYSRMWGTRLLNIADAIDGLDDSIGDSLLSAAEKSLRVRWKLLLNSRPDSFVTCTMCQVAHHPLLPCATSTLASSDPLERTSAPPGEFHEEALILSGKYQGLRGRIIEESGGDIVSLSIDDLATSMRVIKLRLFPLSEGNMWSSDNWDWQGVVSQDKMFLAQITIGSTGKVVLGAFASKLSAARVFDVAARLQFGPDFVLNFDSHIAKSSSAMTTGERPADEWDKSRDWALEIFKGCEVSSPPEHVVEWALQSLRQADEFPPYAHVSSATRRLNWMLDALGHTLVHSAGRISLFLTKGSIKQIPGEDLDEFMGSESTMHELDIARHVVDG